MINKKQILQILSDESELILDYLDISHTAVEYEDFEAVADKILALGKQKPLAKNK